MKRRQDELGVGLKRPGEGLGRDKRGDRGEQYQKGPETPC